MQEIAGLWRIEELRVIEMAVGQTGAVSGMQEIAEL
jgi:hypothetical protein